MTQINLDIKMMVEGYREISEKQLEEKDYYVQLQTSFINENGDLEQKQVKVMKEIDFKSLIGKFVKFKNAVETVIGFDKFYKADDVEVINETVDGLELKKSMIMDVIAVSDKVAKDQKTGKEITNGFIFSKDIVDGAVITYKVKVKNTNRDKLSKVKGQKIVLNNLSVFKPSEGFNTYYSIDSIKDISGSK
jgi:hypothetical protein